MDGAASTKVKVQGRDRRVNRKIGLVRLPYHLLVLCPSCNVFHWCGLCVYVWTSLWDKLAEHREKVPDLRTCLPSRCPELWTWPWEEIQWLTQSHPLTWQEATTWMESTQAMASEERISMVPAAWVTKIHPVLETAQYRGVWVLGEVEVKTKHHTLANLIYTISSRWGRRGSGAAKVCALGVFGVEVEMRRVWGKAGTQVQNVGRAAMEREF